MPTKRTGGNKNVRVALRLVSVDSGKQVTLAVHKAITDNFITVNNRNAVCPA
jgi:hypothetical protein